MSAPPWPKGSPKSRAIRYAPLLPVCVLCIAGAHSAQAQLIEQYMPDDVSGYAPDVSGAVLNRIYAQQNPTGYEVGDTIIRPALSETTGYNSNTLGKPDSGSSELESNAALHADSDWSRDALGVSFDADNLKYFAEPAASYTNFTAGATGALDLGNDRLKLSYTHSALNIAATDLGIIGVTTPVPYSIDDATIAYAATLGRCGLTPAFRFENFGFGRSSGAASLDYSSLNHHVLLESLAGRYEFTPGNAGVMLARFAQAQFQNAGEDDYTDESGFVGLDLRGSAIMQLRGLVGVEQRNFSAAGQAPLTLPSFEISAIWMPTQRDSINATVSRRIDDPTSPFALDATLLDGKLDAYHELASNLFVSASAQLQHSRPEFNNSLLNSSTQTQLNLGLQLIWDISRHMTGTIGYAYNDTLSQNNPAGSGQYPNFNSHTILIGITFYD